MRTTNSKQLVGQQVSKIIRNKEKKKPLKYADVTGTYGVTTAGQVIDFSGGITQGAGTNQRTGDEIQVEYIEMRLSLFCGDTTNVQRVLFVRSKGNSVQNFTNILSLGHAGSVEVNSQYTPYIEKRFRVLSDKNWAQALNGYTSCINEHYRIPVNQKIVYLPGLVTYVDGQIVLYLLSDSGVVPNPSVDFCARIWFRDI